jgi:two-component system CheB/CheR fusion protein
MNAGIGTEAEFELLLELLRHSRGFDFTGYKRPSLMRRVLRRMQTLGLGSFSEYGDYLELHAQEFAHLFNSILINVTSFFRDAPAWEHLAREVLPGILRNKTDDAPVRVWSAGCASGEEAYSIAILLAEAMGAQAFGERAKVYATDVDEEALRQARQASYGPKEIGHLEKPLLERYFEPANGRYMFCHELRRAVIFGRHDLVQDAPIARLDLLLCRNTMMYFNAETQQQLLRRFHFALNGGEQGGGFLFLGRAEMLLTHASLFTPVDLKCRIFRKTPSPAKPARAASGESEKGNGGTMAVNERLLAQALEDSPVARLLVSADGILAAANKKARALFSIDLRDLGKPLKDLEISYRPVEVRSLIEEAYARKRPVTQAEVERRFADGESQYFDVAVAPMLDEAGIPLGVALSYVDVTRSYKLQEEVRKSTEEIQTTAEELQSSNEELETTNEELQSSNEELETTNEELQSTNEELETMNEELQSTNEELQTVNEEMRLRTEEINRLNAFFESVLASLRSAAVVVNQNFDVLMWNDRAQDMWGLRADEVQGRSFLNLDIGLPVAELRSLIRSCLSGEVDQDETRLAAINRRGKKIQVRVACTPLIAGKQREGVILLMDEAG